MEEEVMNCLFYPYLGNKEEAFNRNLFYSRIQSLYSIYNIKDDVFKYNYLLDIISDYNQLYHSTNNESDYNSYINWLSNLCYQISNDIQAKINNNSTNVKSK